MAKKKEINKDEVLKRAERIAKCKQCNGAPPITECNLQGLIFNKCDLCLEIVGEYRKEGKPIKIVKEITVTDFMDPRCGKTIATEEFIPGEQLSFNDLEI